MDLIVGDMGLGFGWDMGLGFGSLLWRLIIGKNTKNKNMLGKNNGRNLKKKHKKDTKNDKKININLLRIWIILWGRTQKTWSSGKKKKLD